MSQDSILLPFALEDESDASIPLEEFNNLVVFSRDWTVEAIISQIAQGNIDLTPEFQRRNAWKDKHKSRLIESLIIGLPVPEIVLAEHPERKRSFVVLDGKQRLLAVAGFVNPDIYHSWKTPELCSLSLHQDLNGLTYNDLKTKPEYSEIARYLNNASLRCTIVTNYEDEDIVYDIFSRLNTASVPLTTQELRQALIRGEFSKFLVRETEKLWGLHKVLKLDRPDDRLVDAELLLRLIALKLFWTQYRGNQKNFLDNSMKLLNQQWDSYEGKCHALVANFDEAIDKLLKVHKRYDLIGRQDTTDSRARFNRALFEVQVLFFSELPSEVLTSKRNNNFMKIFRSLCKKGAPFKNTIESSTHNLANYEARFTLFASAINEAYNIDVSKLYDFKMFA